MFHPSTPPIMSICRKKLMASPDVENDPGTTIVPK
jgi:hypothetical protein